MYQLQNTVTLQDKVIQQYRVAIQGSGGSGKTTSALTFPNPVVLDFDNSVDIYNAQAVGVDPKTVQVIPFYSADFNKSLGASNPRDGFEKWLDSHIEKFTSEQTVIVDSWTFLQDAFDKQTDKEPVYTKTGAVDEFAFWAKKQEYSRDRLNSLQKAKCNLVVVFHEVKEVDDKGRETGKNTPMMTGKFVNKLHNYFPYWFRQIAFEKLTEVAKQAEEAKKMGITTEQFQGIQNSTRDKTLRAWQTVTTSIANCKSKLPFARFIPATFEVFKNPEPWLQK